MVVLVAVAGAPEQKQALPAGVFRLWIFSPCARSTCDLEGDEASAESRCQNRFLVQGVTPEAPRHCQYLEAEETR